MQHLPRTHCLATVLIALGLAGCGSDGSEALSLDATADRQALLDSLWQKVLRPQQQALVQKTQALSQATSAYAADSSEENLSAAQAAFREASLELQRAELMQIGPAARAAQSRGGQGLRDELYSWEGPRSQTWAQSRACRVDDETERQDYQTADFFERKLVSAYGFDVLEVLLFSNQTTTTCALGHRIQRDGLWALLSDDDIRQRRADYAAVVASGLAKRATQLRDAWSNGFSQEFRTAGQGSIIYRSTQEVLDDLYLALYYLEASVRDAKMAGPLGEGAEPVCSSTCPELLESQPALAGASIEWLKANLEGFSMMFYGGSKTDSEAFGFDDLLAAAGASELANEMAGHVDELQRKLDALPAPLAEHLDGPQLRAAYDEISEIRRLLRSQFVSVLAIRLPSEGAADND